MVPTGLVEVELLDELDELLDELLLSVFLERDDELLEEELELFVVGLPDALLLDVGLLERDERRYLEITGLTDTQLAHIQQIIEDIVG